MAAVLAKAIRRAWRSAPFIAVALVLTGCPSEPVPYERSVDRDPNVVLVYAACSLEPTVRAAVERFEAQSPGKSARVETGQPLELVRRIREGDVPDLFVCRGEAEIGLLEREGFLDRGTRHTVRSLRLVLAVPAGNPARIHRVEDLLADRVSTVAMSLPGFTSPGDAGKRALERVEVYAKIQSKLALKQSAEAALLALTSGEADAAVLYDPCLRLRAKRDISPNAIEVGVFLGDETDRRTKVYVVEHKRSPNSLLAQRLIRELTAEPNAPSPEPEPPGAQKPAAEQPAAEQPTAEESGPSEEPAPAE